MDGNKRSITLAVHLHVFDWPVVVARELLVVDHLSVIDEGAVALATRLIRNKHIESAWIINTIFIVDVLANSLAGVWDDITDRCDGAFSQRHRSKPVVVSKLMHDSELKKLDMLC